MIVNVYYKEKASVWYYHHISISFTVFHCISNVARQPCCLCLSLNLIILQIRAILSFILKESTLRQFIDFFAGRITHFPASYFMCNARAPVVPLRINFKGKKSLPLLKDLGTTFVFVYFYTVFNLHRPLNLTNGFKIILEYFWRLLFFSLNTQARKFSNRF